VHLPAPGPQGEAGHGVSESAAAAAEGACEGLVGHGHDRVGEERVRKGSGGARGAKAQGGDGTRFSETLFSLTVARREHPREKTAHCRCVAAMDPLRRCSWSVDSIEGVPCIYRRNGGVLAVGIWEIWCHRLSVSLIERCHADMLSYRHY
jgi:hypothetical protein